MSLLNRLRLGFLLPTESIARAVPRCPFRGNFQNHGSQTVDPLK